MPVLSPRSLALAVATLLLVATAAVAQVPARVDFVRDVRPILSKNCFPCHGPDAAARKADLRLDVRDEAYARAIVPGAPERSELVARIEHADPDERMPPPASGRTLDAAQRATLVAWIAAGAPFEQHWAFRPVVAVEPPVAGDGWASNGIDRFVAARLAADERAPSPEADRATLLRRATLDLTGLPPTLDEVRAFLADPRPDAYERAVDRLLDSPACAEHLARIWLDTARYGDTHGLHLDNYREIWPYRDWVIGAFERNLPYDRFVIEQLAGDLLPDATREQRIATGFLRCNVSTSEGGSIDAEVAVRNVVDRTDTFGTVFLGMTVGCAVCHDHKFDPLTQRDYYSLAAFFASIDGPPLDQNAKDHAPAMKVPSPAQEAELARLDTERATVEARAAAVLADVRAEYREPAPAELAGGPPVETVWIDDELPAGAVAQGAELRWVAAPVHGGKRAMERRGEGLHQHFFPVADRKLRVGSGEDLLFAHVWIDPTDPPRELMLQWNGDGGGDWSHRAYWGDDLIAWGEPGTASRRPLGPLPATGRYVRLEVPAAVVGLGPGSVVHGIAFTQHGGRAIWDTVGIVSATEQALQETIWVDDDVPAGAKRGGEAPIFGFVAGGGEHPEPVAGARVLRRSGGDGLNQDWFTDAAAPLLVQAGDRLFAHVWLSPDDPPRGIQLQFHSAGSWNHRVRWGVECHGRGDGPADRRAGDVPETGRWVRIDVAAADVGLAPGARIDGFAFTQVGGTVYWDAAGSATWGLTGTRQLRSLSLWTELAASDASLPKDVREAAATASEARTAEQIALLRDHFLRHVYAGARERFAPLDAELASLADARGKLDAAIPSTLIWRERTEPVPMHVLRRGQYDQPGDPVARRTPAVLPPMDGDLPRDRLGLARWLVEPEHPLTARVAVNRFWQQMFGVGLVRTAEDFGSQGEPPSHPELLDWLAAEFVRSGWNVRELLRLLATSATYRQSSATTPADVRADPENRLLGRGPRHRLDAEVLRDQALALAGLLASERGGPPVKPPQPDGLWEAVAYVGSNTQKFVADTEPAKVHRRSLYTFWKRTAPPPQMSVLDAPSRESCRVRRERTNTPLQALLLMNDPQYVECARALAERILREGGGDDRARATHGLRIATARLDVDAADVAAVARLAVAEREHFAAAPDAARTLIGIGATPPAADLDPVELAAWTVAANLLLNLDQVVTGS
ncbi:MAG: PSD1 domain-containing protein [Planctomycetes bacterium]|nr:PSD1 domain-containing protein [Planctomycetota bacterium]